MVASLQMMLFFPYVLVDILLSAFHVVPNQEISKYQLYVSPNPKHCLLLFMIAAWTSCVRLDIMETYFEWELILFVSSWQPDLRWEWSSNLQGGTDLFYFVHYN